MQGAFVFETTRSYSGGEAKVRKGLGLGCIACCQVPSALFALSTLFALPPHLRRVSPDLLNKDYSNISP